MKQRQLQNTAVYRRVLVFRDRHRDRLGHLADIRDWGRVERAGEKIAALAARQRELDARSMALTSDLEQLRGTLRRAMTVLHRTLALIPDAASLRAASKVPNSRASTQVVRESALAFVELCRPFAGELRALGVPADHDQQIAQAVDAMNGAERERDAADLESLSATREIASLITDTGRSVQVLDGMIAPTLSGAIAAEWKAAKRVGRSRAASRSAVPETASAEAEPFVPAAEPVPTPIQAPAARYLPLVDRFEHWMARLVGARNERSEPRIPDELVVAEVRPVTPRGAARRND